MIIITFFALYSSIKLEKIAPTCKNKYEWRAFYEYKG